MRDFIEDDFDVTSLKRNISGKKKKINSKAKGNRFENKIAKSLNERFNTKEFCRTPGSGAFATTHKLPEYLKVYGDLITPKDFKYIIECKKGYNEEQICDLLNPKSNISKMIAQASRDSEKCSKKFFLIIGQDRKDPIAITNDLDLPVEGNMFVGVSGGSRVMIVSLKELLKVRDSHFFE